MLNFRKILGVILITNLLIFFLLRVYLYWFWSEDDINKTLNVFQEKRNLFDSLIIWVEKPESRECLKTDPHQFCLPPQFQEITSFSFFVSPDFTMIEIAPVNFYYVMVYSENPDNITKTEVYQDEGKIIKKINYHWTLIRRGWM